MTEFRLIERRSRPGCHEIQVEGELDLAVAPQLEEAIERAGDDDQILISLDRCEFIDSTGISVIIHAHNRRPHSGGVVMFGASEQVHRVLSITGLTGNGLVVENAEQALSRFTPGSLL